MPKKASGIKRTNIEPKERISSEEKIARLLALLVTKATEKLTDQVTMLSAVGFSVSDVASLLGITENHVMVASHHGRRKRRTG